MSLRAGREFVVVDVLRGDWRRAVRPEEAPAHQSDDKGGTIKAIQATHIDTSSGVGMTLPRWDGP